jgi:hypothetical protein
VVDLSWNGKKQRVHVAQLLDRLPGSNAARPVVVESEVGQQADAKLPNLRVTF